MMQGGGGGGAGEGVNILDLCDYHDDAKNVQKGTFHQSCEIENMCKRIIVSLLVMNEAHVLCCVFVQACGRRSWSRLRRCGLRTTW